MVKSVSRSAGGMRFGVDLGKLAQEVKTGDSVAIDGACLTAVRLDSTVAIFDVSGETLEKSTVGKLNSASKVNVELAMKPTDRFGGHFVLGHVDGTATIKTIENKGEFRDIKFAAPAELTRQMVTKGSVSVDGISLTIADMDEGGFTIAIIPQTWEKTTLSTKRVGDRVNIETDVIVKTIKKQLEKILPAKQNLTMEKLKELGF